jgi:uncharacterized protein
MRIGLISDTHGFLDPKVLQHFHECDEIWHAGDIGDMTLIKTLEEFKPVRAVFGNIDDKALQTRYPEDLRFSCEGLRIWITHIAGAPPKYNPRIRKSLALEAPDVLICGHSHILRVKRDPAYGNMLFINPGAAGNQGFHSMKTIIRFTIEKGVISQMEAIDLGKRGALS